MQFEIQAHRGARAFFPENTLQAFCKAADLGVRVIELDFVVSADHRLLVSHDPWIGGPLCTAPDGSRLSSDEGDRRLIYSMRYEDIAMFGCGVPDPCFPRQQEIVSCKPLLQDVFRGIRAHLHSSSLSGPMIFNIELKSWPQGDNLLHPPPDVYAGIIVQELRSQVPASIVRVQSFDRRLLVEIWRRYPDLCFGFLADRAGSLEPFPWEPGFVPAYVNPCFTLLDHELVERLHHAGVRVIPWTVNNPDDMLAMKHMGADGIITDHPELALRLPGLFS